MSHRPSGFKPLMQSRGGENDIGQANLSTQLGNYKCVESNSYRGLAMFRGLWAHRPYCMNEGQSACETCLKAGCIP